jgi:monofunctional biosynthetic peptidoglycan transglycosylase
MASPGPRRRSFAGRLLLLLLAAGTALAAAGIAVETTLPDVRPLARRAPARTALMREREAEAARQGRRLQVDQRWVPYARISPLLRRAVLIAEDDAFFAHGGLDWREIRASARRNLEAGRVVRGGSTITQQLAKNLYLGSARTPLRKLREVLLALKLERTLSKRRIFELYLNLIEWGDGIYGAEAAARGHFGVSAEELTPRQAVLLAAAIINPRRYSVQSPGPRIEGRAARIAGRMLRRGFLTEPEYQAAIGRGIEPRPWWRFWERAPSAPPDSLGAPGDSLAPPEDSLPLPEGASADTVEA